ncbi:dienelactone hydrolase family protein [Massilia sp. TS11]|uniref:dienelactone hydrolase family protein n=1 Tax=Massilia sp. TS11 TaxID=2908003 RepID=UPI001EDBE55C|nr:CocE/NonD family hydrolase [Massilia sp. TS11]MCG2583177.1 prolyl oligopeptidase family serine peptidase [Massilia sp. TS11]
MFPFSSSLARLLLPALLLLPAHAQEAAMPVDARLNEQVLMVPAGPNGKTELETTIFRPNGPGPFPLLIINHGKQPGDPRLQPRERFIFLATEFVKRGYAVMVPMRQGFAHSGGRYRDYGCDMIAHAYAQAEDVLAAIRFAREQTWIDSEQIVVAGQSYGGLASMAVAAMDEAGVKAVINFAGGLRYKDEQCDWRSGLQQAFAHFGRNSQIPSLWLYGANDSYFSPGFVRSLYRRYQDEGGDGELVAYGAFRQDAHKMVASRDGVKVWREPALRFLAERALPTREIYTVLPPPAPPDSRYAALDDVQALPFVKEDGRAAYRAFLATPAPRAFALAPSGGWSWVEDGEDPARQALSLCKKKNRQACRLYAVDHSVVWSPTP